MIMHNSLHNARSSQRRLIVKRIKELFCFGIDIKIITMICPFIHFKHWAKYSACLLINWHGLIKNSLINNRWKRLQLAVWSDAFSLRQCFSYLLCSNCWVEDGILEKKKTQILQCTSFWIAVFNLEKLSNPGYSHLAANQNNIYRRKGWSHTKESNRQPNRKNILMKRMKLNFHKPLKLQNTASTGALECPNKSLMLTKTLDF